MSNPEYNEQEAIEKAVALSLLTAQEDEKRRFEKYGDSVTGRRSTGSSPVPSNPSTAKSMQPTGTSLISRPRPKTSNSTQSVVNTRRSTGSNVPSVPPRPDSKVVEEAKAKHADLHGTQIKPPPLHSRIGSRMSGGTSSNLQPPQRPPPPDHSKKSSPISKDIKGEEKPLIMLSPDPTSVKGPGKDSLTFDFDLDSLDPLNDPTYVKPSLTSKSSDTASVTVSCNNVPTFHSTISQGSRTGTPSPVLSNWKTSLPNSNNSSTATTPVSSNWDSSFAIFGQPADKTDSTTHSKWAAFSNSDASSGKLQMVQKAQTDIPSNPFLPKTTSSGFPNYFLDKNHPPGVTANATFGSQSTNISNQYGYGYKPPLQSSTSPYGYGYATTSQIPSGSSGLIGHNQLRRVPSDQSIATKQSGNFFSPGNDLPYTLNPTSAALTLPSPLTRVPSDSSLIFNAHKETSSKPGEDSDQQFQLFTGAKQLEHSSSQPNIQNRQLPRSNSSNIGELTEDDDLMSFPVAAIYSKDAEELLSLASFDPLYSLDETCDSTGLFTNPYDKFQRKDTPNPFPDINPITTQKLLDQAAGQSTEHSADNKLEKVSPKRKVSTGELLDPFSVSDLTVSLERKRKTHVQEQENRKALLRNKTPEVQKAHLPEKIGSSDRKHMAIKEQNQEEIKYSPRKKRLSRTYSHIAKGRESTYEILQQYNEAAQDEVKAFCDMIARLKREYPYDHPDNIGIIISPRIEYPAFSGITVKVKVTARFMTEPYMFTPSLEVQVEHMVCEVLLSITEDLQSTSSDDYMFKVFGRSEYLLSDTKLGEYEYIQNSLRTDEDIKLILMDYPTIERPLKRTLQDDKQPVLVPKHRDMEDQSLKVTRDKLNILMETFYKEVEKLRDAAIQDGCKRVQCRGVIQAVKAICAVLYKIETIDIQKAVSRLCGVTVNMEPGLQASSPTDRDAYIYVTKEGEGPVTVVDTETNRVSESYTQLDDLHIALEELTKAVKGQIDLFCRTFHTDYRFGSATDMMKEKREIKNLDETLLLNIATTHRIPLPWRTKFENFKVRCGVYYGGKKLCDEIITQSRPQPAEGVQDTLIWDEWMNFESIYLNRLPRETRVLVELIGVKVTQSTDNVLRVNQPLGWAALQIFNHKFELVQGSQLLGLWHNENANPAGTTISATEFTSNCVLLQINLPDFDYDYTFPAVLDPIPGLQRNYTDLHANDQEQLKQLCMKPSSCRLTKDVCTYIWEKRHYLYKDTEALPKVLQSIPAWDWKGLREIYTMVEDWTTLSPTEALELLLPIYPDTFVRTKAVECISVLTDDQLIDLLPQLIQALKFECYHTSALVKLLIERSILNARFAHQLYWLLKEAADDVHFRKRYQLVFGALLSVVGEGGRKEFGKEEDLMKLLAAIAEKVKAAKDKEKVLQGELYNMWDFFEHSTVRLPINPAMIVYGLDCKSCSYFSSNAFPLRLVFKNIEARAESVYTMFKSGDDLRQDMITMQVIRIMDRLWRKEDLDLKIITFRCQATGLKKGLVELVTECDTLRKIQVKHGKGVAGSFKDTTIREWLQLNNPTELEFEKAVDNFIASCAGYCVATYVLGICDRHNDNIMVKQSGHLFHIDFGKFLGDAQMFGNIKRDRTPFVLTSDMAYVINSGDKPSHKFQHFIDLCCTAFNIIRKHSNFFINLFSMMVQSGIPGVNDQATKYVERALLPNQTDTEATAVFTRMIEESLKSTFTQWNFFIHNLAQMKFSGHTEGALLSFIPKTYSIHTDGKITNVEIFGYQKRYNPEKYYVYIIKVDRENQKVPSFIFRRYSEFQELSHKLMCQFPLVRLPSLSNKVLLGRTHVKSVAEERKTELEFFLRDLLVLSAEIAQHDLVYTFFHPMLRDEQDIDKTNLQKLKEPSQPRPQTRKIDGSIKLSLFYKNDEFTVMVMHVKDLAGCGGVPPDPYVKLYLLPDPFKETKKKTKIIKGTFHPTYNEMISYRISQERVKERTLSASVWSYDTLSENEYLGSVIIKLCDVDWSKDYMSWFKLQTNPTAIS